MAGSVNKVIIVGNLGRDPEVRSFQNGGKVVNLRIATSETWRDRNSGERKERTEWHSVAIFSEPLAAGSTAVANASSAAGLTWPSQMQPLLQLRQARATTRRPATGRPVPGRPGVGSSPDRPSAPCVWPTTEHG